MPKVWRTANETEVEQFNRHAIEDYGKYPVYWLFQCLGDRWSLQIILELGDKPLIFSEIRKLNRPISHRMLSLTLKKLTACGLVARAAAPPGHPHASYTLTRRGQALRNHIHKLNDWLQHHMRET